MTTIQVEDAQVENVQIEDVQVASAQVEEGSVGVRTHLRRLVGVWVLGLVALGLVVLHLRPARSNAYLPCPVYAMTGLHCPGCGSTRAASALVEGDVGLALRQNPVLVLLTPYLVWLWARLSARGLVHYESVRSRIGGWGERLCSPRTVHTKAVLVVVAMLVVYFVARNIGPEWLRPV